MIPEICGVSFFLIKTSLKYVRVKKVIVEGEGYVAQCPDCHSVEIAFGTSLIQFGYVHWWGFSRYISDARYHSYNAENKHLKNITLHLGGNGPLQMVLTANELRELCDLVEQADNEIKTISLLEMFSS